MLIKISGVNATTFLQGQFTINIGKLEPDVPRLAAYCNNKGRVIAVFYITKIDNQNYLVDLPGDNQDNFLRVLKKYAVFSRVKVEENTHPPFPKGADARSAAGGSTPTIYQTTSEKFLPHMLNLPELGAIDFDKGCYIGQEIIARTEYRGQVKRKMHKVLVTNAEQDFTPGSEIILDDGSKAIVIDKLDDGFLVIS